LFVSQNAAGPKGAFPPKRRFLERGSVIENRDGSIIGPGKKEKERLDRPSRKGSDDVKGDHVMNDPAVGPGKEGLSVRLQNTPPRGRGPPTRSCGKGVSCHGRRGKIGGPAGFGPLTEIGEKNRQSFYLVLNV